MIFPQIGLFAGFKYLRDIFDLLFELAILVLHLLDLVIIKFFELIVLGSIFFKLAVVPAFVLLLALILIGHGRAVIALAAGCRNILPFVTFLYEREACVAEFLIDQVEDILNLWTRLQ